MMGKKDRYQHPVDIKPTYCLNLNTDADTGDGFSAHPDTVLCYLSVVGVQV